MNVSQSPAHSMGFAISITTWLSVARPTQTLTAALSFLDHAQYFILKGLSHGSLDSELAGTVCKTSMHAATMGHINGYHTQESTRRTVTALRNGQHKNRLRNFDIELTSSARLCCRSHEWSGSVATSRVWREYRHPYLWPLMRNWPW